ncbi:MAG: zf-TFIIB domain-containing protein [Myxococcota bacterium]|nr:zf-TFIIB domain-containing protein [Myxococcota bacterium]
MNCPSCASSDFSPLNTSEGVTVDYCMGCKGIWFEQGELAFYVETSEDLPLPDASKAHGTPSTLSCPQCDGGAMTEMPYLQGEDLRLDHCDSCSGIWLDAKEIVKLEELARRVEPAGKVLRTVQQLEKMGYQVLGTVER